MINGDELLSIFDFKRRTVPAICVEMSGNHQGRKASAVAFASAAKAAGADLLKLQVYRPDTITMRSDRQDFRIAADNDWSEYGTLYDLYESAHTPWEWVAEIFEEARRISLPVWASPFDLTSVQFLEELNCPIYKIASPEITDLGLIEACARTGKPVVMSTGLASQSDLDDAIEIVRTHAVPFMILKCVSAYPTPVEDMNVSTIPWLRETYGCAVGLSDHTLGPEAAYAATALGAAMIEKHFRMPEDDSSVDSGFSMSLEKLPALKTSIQAIHAAVGNPTMEIPDIAIPSLGGRRSLYVVNNVREGELLTKFNVRSIRPCYGMAPKYLPKVLGRRATRNISAGERLTWDLIEGGQDKK